MNVRKRLLIAIGATLIATTIGVFAISQNTLMSGFVGLEDERARADLNRVDQAFDRFVTDFHDKSIDWAAWDDTYRYMQDRNPGYVASNMVASSLASIKVDAVLLLDQKRQLVYGMVVPDAQRSRTIDTNSLRRGLSDSGLLRQYEESYGRCGIARVSGNPLIVSVRPILPTSATGASRGYFVFVRKIEASLLAELRAVTRQNISYKWIERLDSSIVSAILESPQKSLLTPVDGHTLSGYLAIRDVRGVPTLLLRTDFPRSVTLHGRSVVGAITWQLTGVGILFGIVVIYVIQRFALSRLQRLSRQVASISDFTGGSRVDFEGEDEISMLSVRINEMLARVEADGLLLRENEEALRQHNEHLEELVDERTRQIEHQALHDKLTGLPNRALFMDRTRFGLEKVRRSQRGVAALFIDLDNFKLVNDSLGHSAGDELLIQIAQRLVESVRPGDTVARLGGDEFTVLIEDLIGIEGATDVADRILASLKLPIVVGSREMYASASIGLAYSRDPNMSADSLLKHADTAMYRAKASGKSSSAIYEPSMEESALERLELETALRKAIQNNELTVVYQPLIDLTKNEMIGAEALVRWNHPTRGPVQPADFIPIAEETGLIIPIGYWVLEEACRQATKWVRGREPSSFSMSVNLSGVQLQRDDVAQRVGEILEKTGLDPRYLKLEITESVLMEDQEAVVSKMHQIRAMGVLLSLDDFGTGYSSLSTLGAFPIDTLKIDRAFISRLGEEDGALGIVEAILALARTLQMKAVGEGVETASQEEIIKGLGCQSGQGFLYDKPLSVEDFESRLARQFELAAQNEAKREAA